MLNKTSYYWSDDERAIVPCLDWDCTTPPILSIIDVFRQVSEANYKNQEDDSILVNKESNRRILFKLFSIDSL